MTRDGLFLSPRSISTIRLQEQGAAGAEKNLVQLGARKRAFGEYPVTWADEVLPSDTFTQQHQQGKLDPLRGPRLEVSGASALDIRCGWSLAKVLGADDVSCTYPLGIPSVQEWLIEAEQLGYRDGLNGTVPLLFAGTPLATEWESGARFRCECEADRGGTQEEWDALDPDRQDAYWDTFHDMCARGVGDGHQFYEVLMNKWLVGYLGH